MQLHWLACAQWVIVEVQKVGGCMRQVGKWGIAVLVLFVAACGTEVATPSEGLDAGADDAESVDWKPSGKDVPVSDAADAGADAAPDANANDAADAAKVDVIADVGGGLPSEITEITYAKSLFDVQGIHEVKVTVDPAEWAAYMDGVSKPDGQKVYNWHKADIELDGIPYATVGIHGFGNGSQIDNPSKPNMRFKFDKYNLEGMGPEGQKAFRLKASGQDPTYLREPIAGALLRSIGGDAPRFSWAHVVVNGTDMGPYLLQESIDKRYFHNTFGNNDGGKFETVYGCLGFDCPAAGGCAALKSAYVGDPGDPQVIVDAAQAITNATEDQFPAVLDQYVYTDELLADYAVDALLSNIDGFASAGQNFTFYADEMTKKFHLIATGTDLTFGNFGKPWYELMTPWGPPNSWCKNRADQLYQRIWAHPVLKQKLLAKFQALQCGLFRDTTLLPLIDSYHNALKPFIYNEPKGIYTPKQVDAYYTSVEDYVTKRQTTLSDLLGPCK